MTPVEIMALATVKLEQPDVAEAIERGEVLKAGHGLELWEWHKIKVRAALRAFAEMPPTPKMREVSIHSLGESTGISIDASRECRAYILAAAEAGEDKPEGA